MSLIRGMRSLSYKYTNDFHYVPETEENMKSHIILETDDDDESCSVQLSHGWPEHITLNARMVPDRIDSSSFVERFENGKSLGRNNIYANPIIYHNSDIANPNVFCSKLAIKFENFGEYFLYNRKNGIFGKSFNEYELECNEDCILFEKDFLISAEPIVEKLTINGGTFVIEGTSNVAPYRIYAYGGFYEHGSHPHEIESCVFQINSGNSTSAIKIWKFSAFRQKCGFDATMDKDMGNGVAFIGIKNFSPSNKATLYDELIGGACNIKLSNKLTGEIAVYKSNGVFHIQNTDLIKINFIKGE